MVKSNKLVLEDTNILSVIVSSINIVSPQADKHVSIVQTYIIYFDVLSFKIGELCSVKRK